MFFSKMLYNIITWFLASSTHVFHKKEKVRKYKSQLVHESDFDEYDKVSFRISIIFKIRICLYNADDYRSGSL